jgi:hypothetical protein
MAVVLASIIATSQSLFFSGPEVIYELPRLAAGW